jgi:DNA-binding response OmpR family regulator
MAMTNETDETIKVLLVEDDERLAKLTGRYLEEHGLKVTLAATGPQAVEEAGRWAFDVVLLDLMLPGKDGMEVCRELRRKLDVPIIMVTARREEADRVMGLDAGADDYVTKPFSSRELVARIRAVVRRARGRVGPALGIITAGAISIDPASMRVTVGEHVVDLTGYEFALLKALAERVGRVVSRDQLLEILKDDPAAAFDRSIDVQVSRLRQKLGDDARQSRHLKTIRGAGYMLVAESTA